MNILQKNPFLELREELHKAAIHFKEVNLNLAKTVANYKRQLELGLKTLALSGWYVSYESGLSDGIVLGQKVDEKDFEFVDSFMQRFYKKNLTSIIKRLGTSFPERKRIFDEALLAHKKKMYHGSILLFLSQADGICNGYLYKSNKGKKEHLKKDIEKNSKVILESLLTVLLDINEIDIPHAKRKLKQSLNRHAVMHGFDTNFGTEINSLKALSLVAFVGDFFYDKKD